MPSDYDHLRNLAAVVRRERFTPALLFESLRGLTSDTGTEPPAVVARVALELNNAGPMTPDELARAILARVEPSDQN